jgi:hypothetical protein
MSVDDRRGHVRGVPHPGQLARVHLSGPAGRPARSRPVPGLCPAWPQWAERTGKARKYMDLMASRTPAPVPAQQPLAVIPGDLPIEDVVARPTELQAVHPGAQVRRGSRNRWEIWPPSPGRGTVGQQVEVV